MSTDKVDLTWEDFGGPGQNVALRRRGVRDDGPWPEMRGQICENLAHAPHRRRHNNNVRFSSGLCQIPGAAINGAEFLCGPLLIKVRVKSDHFQGPPTISLPFFGPTSKCETYRTPNQSETNDQDSLHGYSESIDDDMAIKE
jgi:hypothetical protein